MAAFYDVSKVLLLKLAAKSFRLQLNAADNVLASLQPAQPAFTRLLKALRSAQSYANAIDKSACALALSALASQVEALLDTYATVIRQGTGVVLTGTDLVDEIIEFAEMCCLLQVGKQRKKMLASLRNSLPAHAASLASFDSTMECIDVRRETVNDGYVAVVEHCASVQITLSDFFEVEAAEQVKAGEGKEVHTETVVIDE